MNSKLRFEEDQLPKTSKFKAAYKEMINAAAEGTINAAHRKMKGAEDDNAAVEAAHSSEVATEKTAKLAQSSIRKKGQNKQYHSHKQDSKWYQKHQIKKRYQEAIKTTGNGKQAAEHAASASGGLASKLGEMIKDYVVSNKKMLIAMGLGILLVIVLMAGLGSCSLMLSESGTMMAATTYLSDDDEINSSENQYVDMETSLKRRIDHIESDNPGYDEYNYDIAEIGHNPYSLISYLSSKYQIIDASTSEVEADIQALFGQQYTLIKTRIVEVRYRTETRTRTRTNPTTGETSTTTYTVQVPYNYYILNVKLQNNGVDRYIAENLNDDQLVLYTAYQNTMGNRSYLFGEDAYSSNFETGDYADYTIPREALNDERFAALMEEATKYLGYPYVWGGSTPSTSFDCSGYVCWVLRESGVYNISRTTAQGIYNQCARVSPSQAKPGDIIFFTGTYNSGGDVSHVGIYVGDGMMIHCGNPIQYASINSNYWKTHFYAFGRLN